MQQVELFIYRYGCQCPSKNPPICLLTGRPKKRIPSMREKKLEFLPVDFMFTVLFSKISLPSKSPEKYLAKQASSVRKETNHNIVKITPAHARHTRYEQ